MPLRSNRIGAQQLLGLALRLIQALRSCEGNCIVVSSSHISRIQAERSFKVVTGLFKMSGRRKHVCQITVSFGVIGLDSNGFP